MGKKTFHRFLSVLLAVAMLLSTGIGSAFAAENDTATTTLADGEYIVPIQNWGGYATTNGRTDKKDTGTSISASPRALLTVQDGTYTVTMKLNSKYMGGRIFAEPDDVEKGAGWPF